MDIGKLGILLCILGCFNELSGADKTLRTRQITAGKTLRLKCRENTGSNSSQISWIVPNTASGRQTLVSETDSSGDLRHRLSINNITLQDTGYYYCVSNKSNPAEWLRRVYVYVYDGEHLLLNTETVESVDVIEGDDFVLPCRITNENAIVIASKPSSKIDNKMTYDRAIGFIITEANENNEGLWKCKAKLGEVTSTKHIYVDVKKSVKPELGKVFNESVYMYVNHRESLVGQSILLVCEVSINRELRPTFVWTSPTNSKIAQGYTPDYKDIDFTEGSDTKVYDPNRKNLGDKVWQMIYYITNVSINDSGNYQCQISDQKSETVNLKIHEKQYFKITKHPTSCSNDNFCRLEIFKGETADLSFTFDAFPVPAYVWFNGSDIINKTNTQMSEYYTLSKSKLRIQNVDFSDSNNYTLFVSSEYLAEQITVELVVLEPIPPVLTTDLAQFTNANLDSDVTIFCNVTGGPTPEIQWFHNNNKLEKTNKMLVIENLKEEDSGNYTCRATNKAGFAATSTQLVVKDPSHQRKVAYIFVSIVTSLTLVVLVWFMVFKTKRVKKLQKQLHLTQQYLVPILDKKDMPIEEKAQCQSYDAKKWEFPRDRLKFGKTLGRGAYGKVVQATAFDIERKSSCKTVAVKMLKVGSRSSEYQALMSELRILIHLGPHLNIVNLLGACTTKEGPLMIVVEYCRFGNLSTYLRSMRDCYTGARAPDSGDKNYNEIKKSRLMSEDSGDDGAFLCSDEVDRSSWLSDKRASRGSCVSGIESVASQDCGGKNRLSLSSGGCEDSRSSLRKDSGNDEDLKGAKDDEKHSLNLTDILSYSLQIARGMEFLASKKCIHRDLAARNILVADYKVVKICDFGLARDVYKDPDYVRTGEARLPIKWMAPESIFDKVYTTKSDVWSYGVLLWEIFTLGASPYPGLQIDEDFCNKLQRGVRMGKPKYANDTAYSTMLACWADSPEERPTFTKLCEEISDGLQAEAGHEYLDILKLFESSLEGKVPLRGVSPQQTPKETFEEIKNSRSEEMTSDSGYVVDYSSAKVPHVEINVPEKRENYNQIVVAECTNEKRNRYHSQTSIEVYESVDSGLCTSTNKNLLYVDASSYRSLDTCSAASSCDCPPLYDDVIAARELM